MDFSKKTIGFALSGGGSKGLAQAGAIKFLEEQNIKPNFIAGTSAGAIIGALYSWGKSPEEILEFFKSIYFFHWKHLTLRKPGIIDSSSFKKYFDDIFKDATLNDLKIPIFITATDMVKGELKIFSKETKITDALLASSAFPGMISPYVIEDSIYCDGGVLNHFPSDLLSEKCDFNIGIYVSPLEKITHDNLKSIKSVTSRAFDLFYANSNIPKFKFCDCIIEPHELSHFSTFETSKTKMNTIFEIGYNAAKKTFEELNE
ncbi:patatin-like phospholipase family protein [Flavobacterium capsici]|uniref:Patatin-like phospholipase family protein n=1 Tax=Flavobacterium capsici TaxID=3075618 RepID=A0AA96EZU3_9FLAO|nr:MULTISPECIES: patatin-like phospholipase family protein [unclassified Flavobacterium]WNM19872.1 patatin-like phospholipase family protein [Flavobacterium sp. PMR2A8]WNM21261.1 patatin-like phospholipase family protein [Flavobacterium sp. PMTSA4]